MDKQNSCDKPKTKCCNYSQDLPTKLGHDFDNLANLVGQFMEYWGFKKIHGQIWTHIFLSDCPVDATTIVKRLKVSKALVSLAIKDLLHYKVIESCAKGPKRTVYFAANPNILHVITEVLKHRERKMLDEIKEAMLKVKYKKPDSIKKEKIQVLEDMVLDASDFLDVMISTELSVEATPKD